jgi:DNA-binding IclR family transcriptional regulator
MAPGSRRRAAEEQEDIAGKYRVAAIAHAVGLLKQFTRQAPPLSADALSRSTGLSPALTRRTLHTLQRHGFIGPLVPASGNYQLGMAWLWLADAKRRQFDIRQVAIPTMRRMRDAVNETVIISIAVDGRWVSMDYIESRQQIRRITQRGSEAPLHCGATGWALLAGFTPEQLADYLRSLPAGDDAGGAESAWLAAEIDMVRRQGYAVAQRETTADTAAVAAAVRDHHGSVVAALTISCPEDRLTPELREACVAQVVSGAREVSRLLGYDDQPVAG